ncbi:hypothetical protein CMV_024396 [Castanea mollissima]|uniref:Uncharacterized protein n=1 Tax=Castanea mollissima TaxID=60419 RepID=A0A8J4QAQ5_9ROSI|nr:hypothetical protein CMV_024396 [Castanea mollissima]
MFSLFSKFTAGAPEIRRFPPFGNNESDAYWIRIGNQGFRNRNPLWVRYEENPQVRDWLAQMNVGCYTESPAGHRGPSGKAMIYRERITHSSIGDRCTNDNSKRHTSVAYLPFRWHQRDPAKVRNFMSRLLHSTAVS